MATVYSDNYTLQYVNKPSEKIPKGEQTGRVHNAIARYTFAADVNAIGTVIKLFKLPAGARITNFKCYGPSLGTTGIFTAGILANGVDSADADAFGSYDFGGQAVNGEMNGTLLGGAVPAGQDLTLGAETDIVLTATEATDSADGDEIKAEIEYVID